MLGLVEHIYFFLTYSYVLLCSLFFGPPHKQNYKTFDERLLVKLTS